MRLYLDERDGTSLITCPCCSRPLLLAAERRGRWVVGYQHLHLRPGRLAMLVCPDAACDHKEDVEIVATPDDAVIYSSSQAASRWSVQERYWELTLDEIQQRLERLWSLYNQTGNPKLPSAFRFWRERFRFEYWSIMHGLRRGLQEDEDVVLEGKELREQGRVKEIQGRAVLLDRSDGTGTVLVRLGELRQVAGVLNWPRGDTRFDFGDGLDIQKGNHVLSRSTRFVIVAGCRLELDSVTRHGACHVRTDDAETARDLGLQPYYQGSWGGEIPASLVERCFRSIRFCYVQGHRLNFLSVTKDPEIIFLGTRNMETARVLKMRRDSLIFCGQREQLRWHRFFNRSEIERTEEKQIPRDIWELVRYQQKRR